MNASRTIRHIALCSAAMLLTVPAMAQNLLTNGSFENATNEFTTDYIYTPSGSNGYTINSGSYCVATSPKVCNVNAVDFKDHTTGTGKMLNVNGSYDAAIVNVWKKTVAVTPNQPYQFTGWIASWGIHWDASGSDPSPARIKVFINDVQIGNPFAAPAKVGVWSQFAFSWNSQSATSATIRIVDENLTYDGNDFSLDDLSFERLGVPQQVSGNTFGLKPLNITCKNVTTGKSVVLPAQSSPYWNCMAAGLVAKSKDVVQVIVSGPYN